MYNKSISLSNSKVYFTMKTHLKIEIILAENVLKIGYALTPERVALGDRSLPLIYD